MTGKLIATQGVKRPNITYSLFQITILTIAASNIFERYTFSSYMETKKVQ